MGHWCIHKSRSFLFIKEGSKLRFWVHSIILRDTFFLIHLRSFNNLIIYKWVQFFLEVKLGLKPISNNSRAIIVVKIFILWCSLFFHTCIFALGFSLVEMLAL